MVGGVVFKAQGIGVRVGNEDDIACCVILVGCHVTACVHAGQFAVIQVIAERATVQQAARDIEALPAGVVVCIKLVGAQVAQSIAALDWMVGCVIDKLGCVPVCIDAGRLAAKGIVDQAGCLGGGSGVAVFLAVRAIVVG